MRKYLSTLHERSDRHKRRFAFGSSALVTLTIFGLWSLATFGTGGTLAVESRVEAQRANKDVSPFQSIQSGVASSFEGLTQAFGGAKASLKGAADFKADYTEMKGNVLNTYGQ